MTPAPHVPISWGELIDKIAILEIKQARIAGEMAAAHIAGELALLQAAAAPMLAAAPALGALAAALQAVNMALWEIEDAIREKEAAGDFGAGFVALARAVYRHNDERARLKGQINRLLDSELVEEKSYKGFAS